MIARRSMSRTSSAGRDGIPRDVGTPACGAGFPTRTMLATPLLREGVPIGVICLRRSEVQAVTDKQIELAKTFADQAVIAIENVRLFTELEGKNLALTKAHAQVTEALDQQTATSEILRVISSSPTDVQPVFDAIVGSAVRLCEARYGAVFSFDGQLVHLVAHHNFADDWLEDIRQEYPMRPTTTRISGRAILSGSVVQIPDHALDPDYGSPHATRRGFRSLLGVPILRERRAHRIHRHLPAGGWPVSRKADRAAEDLCRPGGDRHRERAAVHGAGGPEPRADRGPRAADGHGRDPAGDLQLADRPPARLGRHGRERARSCRATNTGLSAGG